MTQALERRVSAVLAQSLDPAVAQFAEMLGKEAGAAAVLFYGSNLRTGSLEGILDFYVLLPGPQRDRVWPRVSFREWTCAAGTFRAKIATMSQEKFAQAAAGKTLDTTIWARFVQPSALAWSAHAEAERETVAALTAAAVTASRLAAALGPVRGNADAFWRALFTATYRAEFRVESPGREGSILAANPSHFEGLLPAAWEAAGIVFARHGEELAPDVPDAERAAILRWWRRRQRLGKPLNVLRLAKAATTFKGAAAYGAWKLHRHTGIQLVVTPFRERHPLLAMPGAAWELWRVRRRLGR